MEIRWDRTNKFKDGESLSLKKKRRKKNGKLWRLIERKSMKKSISHCVFGSSRLKTSKNEIWSKKKNKLTIFTIFVGVECAFCLVFVYVCCVQKKNVEWKTDEIIKWTTSNSREEYNSRKNPLKTGTSSTTSRQSDKAFFSKKLAPHVSIHAIVLFLSGTSHESKAKKITFSPFLMTNT